MHYNKKQVGLTAFAALAFCITFVNQAQADTMVIEAGFDLGITGPGTFVKLTLPPAFFGVAFPGGAPSDPLVLKQVDLKGQPTGAMGKVPTTFDPGPFDELAVSARHAGQFISSVGDLPRTDTIIQRGGTTLPNPGDTATVPIEINSLSLRNIDPLEVTYGGGMFTAPFDVFVTLAPGAQAPGSMTLTRTGEDTGTWSSILPVNALIAFTPSPPDCPPPTTCAHGPIVVPVTLTSTGGTFTVVPEPATVCLLALGGVTLLCRKRRLRQ